MQLLYPRGIVCFTCVQTWELVCDWIRKTDYIGFTATCFWIPFLKYGFTFSKVSKIKTTFCDTWKLHEFQISVSTSNILLEHAWQNWMWPQSLKYLLSPFTEKVCWPVGDILIKVMPFLSFLNITLEYVQAVLFFSKKSSKVGYY